MHPSQTELLELRDGKAAAEIELHVRSCPRCARELGELRIAADALRDLPFLTPEEDLWPRVAQAVVARRRRMIRRVTMAAAAAVLAATTVLIAVRFDPPREVAMETAPADAELAVRQLQAASRELERVLQSPSLRSPVLTPQRAAVIVDLEDRIAIVDFAISERTEDLDDPRAVALWSDRVELLDALVVARGGTRGETGLQYASFKQERGNQ